MSQPNGPDPLDVLRAADPIDPADVPSASLARVSARIQETIMSDTQDSPSTQRARRPFALLGAVGAVGALALVIALGSAPGRPGPSPVAVVPSSLPTSAPTEAPSDAPSVDPNGGGGEMASCIRYETSILPTFDIVFDGTATAVDGDQVTFDINTAWKGVDGSITLTAPSTSIALVGPTPDFTVGGRYLVTAAGSNINSCGFTLDYDAATAATWAAAFGG